MTFPVMASDEDEPPLGYTLKIDGKEILLEPGKEVKVEGKFENPSVKLVPNKERTFSAAGITFKYPAYFTFEADFTTKGIKMWTLSGKDLLIMVHALETAGMNAQSMAQAMKSQYGKGAKTSPITRTIHGEMLKGVRLNVSLVGTSMVQDVLEVPTTKGSRILIIQDLKPGEKISEEESKLAMALLDESFRRAEAP